ncbi:MAG: radical SAM protein [Anaerolineae bacterium]|nr:radical SAM protein [Anaerolineae bacterium]
MKVLLVFPPHWHPVMPHLALPALTAYLRSNGVEVIQRDLNIEVFDRILSISHLRATLRRLRKEEKRIPLKGLTDPLQQANLEAVAWAKRDGQRIAADIDQAKAVMRSERFFDVSAGREALLTLADGLMLASVPFFPSEFSIAKYQSAYPVDISRAIRASTQDIHFNFFRNLLETTIVPQIRAEKPDVVGISLTSSEQIVAAFTLASLIKEARLPTHVTLGGKLITGWRDLLPKAEPLWDLFDSATAFEGEVALLRLVEALAGAPDGGADLSAVPNLMYRDGSGVRVNGFKEPEPTECLPIPDFDGLPLDLYLAPSLVLPVWASRGCYWGRCAFCNVGYGESKHFDELQAERVVEEMTTLSKAHGTKNFFFADEALTPRMLRALSSLLIERSTSFNWATCARFEPSITADLLKQMRRAGCRMLSFGMESGSQRVLDRMDKGTDVAIMRRILWDSAAAGIWNHAFMFFGFPGETEEDAHETIAFFQANRNVIHSISSGTFLLERYARVSENPEAYGIGQMMPPGPQQDLAYYFEYAVPSGISSRRAEELEAAFVDSLPDKPNPQFYVHEVYQFLYACSLADDEPLPTMLG